MRDGTHKIKIYFDTSVLSYLKQDDSPERNGVRAITNMVPSTPMLP